MENKLASAEEEPFNNGSHKKPLTGISHKITEKKTPPTPGEGLLNSYVLPKKAEQTTEAGLCRELGYLDRNPNIYLLIQKMKMMLNSLTSIMSQLLDRVDVLSVELNRTKKLVSPMEMKPKSQAPFCP